jgi:sec-independent protein translocase protein TatC
MLRRHPPDSEAASMSLGDHIEELRRRLVISLLGLAGILLVMLWFGRTLVWWLCQPLFEAQRQLGLPQQTLNLSVAGGFVVYLKVSLIATLAVGAPWVIYQLWQFVKPGLYHRERRVFMVVGPMSAGLTALAVLILYYLFLPAAISFLLVFSINYPPPTPPDGSSTSLQVVTRFFNRVNALIFFQDMPPESHAGVPAATAPSTRPAGGDAIPHLSLVVVDRDPDHPAEGEYWFNRTLGEMRVVVDGQTRVLPLSRTSFMVPQIEINHYLDFVILMGLVTILSFQLPAVMTLLGAVGLIRAEWFAKRRKYVLFGFFVLGIFITPSQDAFSNVIFPLMLYGLFELGLLFIRLLRKDDDAAETVDAES